MFSSAPFNHAGACRFGSHEDFEQGRFARAIGSDDADPFAAGDFQGDIFPKFKSSKDLLNSRTCRTRSPALVGIEREVNALLHRDSLNNLTAFLQTIESFLAALGLFAALPGLEPADEFFLLGDILLLNS